MWITIGDIRRLISEALVEAKLSSPMPTPTPPNKPNPTSPWVPPVPTKLKAPSKQHTHKRWGQRYKIGKIDDENFEMSSLQAETMFPGSTDAWVEVVPDIFPDYPFDDPIAIKMHTMWIRTGDQLRVAFTDQPNVELAYWDASRMDWFPIEH